MKRKYILCNVEYPGFSFFFTVIVVFSIFVVTNTFGWSHPGNKKKQPPNVILITIDALRADHLSCYGYHRNTSPFIDSISAKGTIFTHAYSTSSWTVPSMASVFTSLIPRSHGVKHGVFAAEKKEIVNQEMLNSKFLTIATELKKAGYKTFGVSSNLHISSATGFDHGFDHFTTLTFKKAPLVNNVVIRWIKEIENAPRYFLWVHYFDPHDPYFACKPWITEYSSEMQTCREWSRLVMKDMRERLKKEGYTPVLKKALIDLYDSEINYCDRYLSNLFDLVKPGKNTLIIISSDHGEELIDHGNLGHGHTLYEEVLRVPLIIKLPYADDNPVKRIITPPVSNRNIFATILDVVGIVPPGGVKGQSLLSFLTGNTTVETESIFTELDRVRYIESIRSGKWKLIITGRHRKKRVLYDLQIDPSESKNVMKEYPQVVRELEIEVLKWKKSNPLFNAKKTNRTLSKKQLEILRSLGYIE